MKILGLPNATQPTFANAVSHYNRTRSTDPDAPAQVVSDTRRGMTADRTGHQSEPQAPAPGILSAAGPGHHRSSLAILDEAEAVQAADQELHRQFALGIELAATRALLAQEHGTVQRLLQAVSSRDFIGQAEGILMERHRIGADTAFAVLREKGWRSNRKLVDVAPQLIYTGRQETH